MVKTLLKMLLLLGLAACSVPAGDSSSTVTPGSSAGQSQIIEPVTTAGPKPYLTASPSPTGTPVPPLVEVVIPTPTPFSYAVVQGDTLGSIAQRFGVTLDALVAANPTVDPNAMPIGTVLKIPATGEIAGLVTPTPAPVTLRQLRCWPTADNGLWCFALVQNEFAQTLENLSAQFTLQESASQVAYAPLNILPAGQSMPIVAYFTPPVPANSMPRFQVLTAILLPPSDRRYIPVSLQNILVEIDWSGRTAHVTGQAMPIMLDGRVNKLWILGVAYDTYGNLVGLRRWDSTEPVAGGVNMPFDFWVSSVGPRIDRLDLLAEARP